MSDAAATTLAIILAAGLGTRMKSDTPKVMHPIGGVPMLRHVLMTAKAVCGRRAVVIGPDMEIVANETAGSDPDAGVHIQQDRLGTAHAAAAARSAVSGDVDFVLVMFGDTPLLKAATVSAVADALRTGADVCALGFTAEDPTGYGRLIMNGDRLVAIREHADATDEERRITFCNSGVMGFRAGCFLELIDAIGNDNPKGEYYLTDAIEIANRRGFSVTAIAGESLEFLGINSRAQLAEAEAVFQDRLRRAAMDGGVTMVAPETVFLCADTVIGRDVLIEPNVIFGPKVKVADNVTIHAFCHIEDAEIGEGASIGPFARIRPGTVAGPKAKIGNFVETKKAIIGEGAKLNHLSYLGDVEIGAKANIGAGTITCNYDGFNKFKTEIGAGAFIGSNSALVAPVTIGDGAYVGSGSVVTSAVPADALAVARGRQANMAGWAKAFRDKNKK
ncbi:MAG: bifunctional UDP-N-acetylglucosamine diphosphorylase/glucosamine-1-phosphate N-acetyltransferase GlmU [Rhodobiaceae bacterium]|nr:bifunctional UDP-N-acetylglucosamine diphosphorylase/glucosamine-1-phosphate N-acetyltransferase GlmU [Rhodobiaceae bacterium]